MAAVIGTGDLKYQVPGKQRDEKNTDHSCLDASVSLAALPIPLLGLRRRQGSKMEWKLPSLTQQVSDRKGTRCRWPSWLLCWVLQEEAMF